MAKLLAALAASALLLTSLPARADTILEGSLGSGVTLSPHAGDRVPTNLMLAAGYRLSVFRLELGVVGNLADVKDARFDLDLRPMLTVKPPLLPVYGRVIAGVSGLLEGPTALTWGGALGARLGLGAGAFLEAGVLSRRIKVDDRHQDAWYGEGRFGIYWD